MSGAAHVGLCASCANARTIVSAKGSTFWLCELSRVDSRFSKYPPLPVRACPGHAPALRDAAARGAGSPDGRR